MQYLQLHNHIHELDYFPITMIKPGLPIFVFYNVTLTLVRSNSL